MGSCPICGRMVVNGTRFCDICGGPVELEPRQGSGRIVTKEDVVKKIRASMADGPRTDKRIPPIYALLALLPLFSYPLILLMAIFSPLRTLDFDIFRFMVVIGRPAALLASAVVFGVIVYVLLERINAHTRREERLRAGLMSYLRLASAEAGEERAILDDLLRLSSYNGQARVYEKKLDGGRWGLAVFAVFFVMAIPSLMMGVQYLIDDTYRWSIFFGMVTGLLSTLANIVALIILVYLSSHLMATIYTHDLRWTAFVNSLAASMRVIGKELKTPAANEPLKERSFVIYAILTFVTLGLFTIYWLYVLIKDPNNHFETHDAVEPEILRAIG